MKEEKFSWSKGGVLLAWLALVKQTGAVHRHRLLLINREMKHDDTVCSTDLYKRCKAAAPVTLGLEKIQMGELLEKRSLTFQLF